MRMLVEQEEQLSMLIESTTDSKGVSYIEGPFLMAEAKNRNGRFYPKSLMEKCVAQYTKEFIN